MYHTYILKTSDDKYYIGSTGNLLKRVERHNAGGSVFTRAKLPVVLVYSEMFMSRAEAVARERQIKSWKSSSHIDKLIASESGPIV